MENPQTLLEQIFFTTMRVVTPTPGGTSTGTGFSVLVPVEQGDPLLVLVTNKHVLRDAAEIRLRSVGASPGGEFPVFGSRSDCVAQAAMAVGHPDDEIDVAALVLTGLPVTGSQPFLRALPVAMLENEQALSGLDAIEPVTFVGYPNGLQDTVNMTPIARRGWTATPITLDYGGAPTFLIDASVFPGSSGSPVLILDSGGYSAKGGGLVIGGRVMLLGILAAVHVQKATGEIITTASEHVSVDQMIDLGIVYKTRTILETIDSLLAVRGQVRSTAPVAGAADHVGPTTPPDGAVPEADP